MIEVDCNVCGARLLREPPEEGQENVVYFCAVHFLQLIPKVSLEWAPVKVDKDVVR